MRLERGSQPSTLTTTSPLSSSQGQTEEMFTPATPGLRRGRSRLETLFQLTGEWSMLCRGTPNIKFYYRELIQLVLRKTMPVRIPTITKPLTFSPIWNIRNSRSRFINRWRYFSLLSTFKFYHN